MNKNKLNALINLLDDPDKTVSDIVEKELLRENDSIIPLLEEKWENSYNLMFQERIENLIQELHFKKTYRELKTWLENEERNLFNGFWIVDRFQYPDLNFLSIELKIEKIRKQIWLELNNSLTLLEKVTILNHFFFNVNGISINHSNKNSSQNCFLSQILDSKKANPVSIAILYLIIARQLELPAFFIDFPKNPLIAIVDSELAKKIHGDSSETDVLFYINPSHKGAVTSLKEINYHLKKNDFSPAYLYTEPQDEAVFILRLLEMLEESYNSLGMEDKEAQIKQLIKLFEQ